MTAPKSIVLAVLLCAFNLELDANAVTVVVHDPCGESYWLDTSVSLSEVETVGAASIKVFDQQKLQYIGAESGINSIKGTPTGDGALEIVSDIEMRAYGWCFLINGRESGNMPDEEYLKSDDDKIVWFFAYAHYHEGKWISMCTPTHLELPKFVCNSH